MTAIVMKEKIDEKKAPNSTTIEALDAIDAKMVSDALQAQISKEDASEKKKIFKEDASEKKKDDDDVKQGALHPFKKRRYDGDWRYEVSSALQCWGCFFVFLAGA